MQNKINFIILSVFVLCFQLKAQELKSNASAENSDAIYEYKLHEFILNEDSSSVFNYSNKIRLFNYYSFQRLYGESFVEYNPEYQKLNIRKSETTMANGTVIASPPNAFNEVLPSFASHAAPYMHYKEMVITHTGLEKNALIDLLYAVETQKEYFPGIIGKIQLRERIPIKELEIRVIVPKDLEIFYNVSNGNYEPTIESTPKWKIYKWLINDISLVEHEYMQASWNSFVPTLYISSLSIDNVAKRLKEKHLYSINEDITSLINEISTNLSDKKDKMMAISEYLQNKMGTVKCSPLDYKFKAQTAQSTFDNNVGTALDKSILLKAMLDKISISAQICLFTDKHSKGLTTILPSQVSNILVYIPEFNMFIDPNNEYSQFIPSNLAGCYYFNIETSELKQIKETEYKENTINYSFSGSISNEESIGGNGSITLQGAYAYDFDENQLSNVYNRLLSNNYLSAELQDIKIIKDKTLSNNATITYKGQSTLTQFGEYKVLELPATTFLTDKNHLIVNPAPRNTPIGLSEAFTLTMSYEIEIEKAGLVPISIPNQGLTLKNDIGFLSLEYKLKGSTIIIQRNLQFYNSIIPENQYNQYLQIIQAWYSKEFRTLYFEQQNK